MTPFCISNKNPIESIEAKTKQAVFDVHFPDRLLPVHPDIYVSLRSNPNHRRYL